MRAIDSSRLLVAARDLSALVVAMAVMVFATAVGWQGLVAVCALSATLLFLVLLHARTEHRREWLLLVVLGGLLVLPLASRLARAPLLPVWQVTLLMLAFIGIGPFMAAVRESRWLSGAVLLFFFYLAIGIASSLIGRTRTLAGVYQFISDLKPVLLLMLGYALRWDDRMERWLWAVVRWAWLPMLAMVAFEWGAPGPYYKLMFSRGGVAVSVAPVSGLLPSRASGIFEHPSMLATAAALLALLALSRALSEHADHRGRALRWTGVAGLYGVLLICAVQRQELVACILAAVFMLLLARPERAVVRVVALCFVTVPVLLALWMLLKEDIQRESMLWGVGSLHIESPRAQIFLGAFDLAQRNHPFGAGLGTFAGAGAEKFDLSLYHELGFARYWWWGKQDYLMDTYWPNPIAEIGVYGTACLLLCYVALLFHAAMRAISSTQLARGYWLAAASMMAYELMLSATSPAFQDPRLFLLPAAMYGIAWQCAKWESPPRGDVMPRKARS